MYDFQLEAYIIKAENSANWAIIPLSPQKKTYKELYFNLVGFFYAPKNAPISFPHTLMGCF